MRLQKSQIRNVLTSVLSESSDFGDIDANARAWYSKFLKKLSKRDVIDTKYLIYVAADKYGTPLHDRIIDTLAKKAVHVNGDDFTTAQTMLGDLVDKEFDRMSMSNYVPPPKPQ